MVRFLALAALLFAVPAQAVVTIDWVTVGDPGNACDTQPQGCFGAVAYTYRIAKFEVTNAQYTEFLNAVADDDTNGLYNTSMGSGFGGITQSDSSPNFSYSAIAGREDRPVNFVSFYDAVRFANWLQNGQGTGDTETGAYTLLGGTPEPSNAATVARNVSATVFLPNEDERYKAAFYNAATTSYFDYPAGSDTQTTCAVPGATANTANCEDVIGGLTDVGGYTGSASPYGTFDQGGNGWEWDETGGGCCRDLDGGHYLSIAAGLGVGSSAVGLASLEGGLIGIRVASLVSPVPTLSPAGLLVFAAGLLGFIGYYRRRF